MISTTNQRVGKKITFLDLYFLFVKFAFNDSVVKKNCILCPKMTSRHYEWGYQGFCDNSTKALVLKRETKGVSKIIENCVSLFIDDPSVTFAWTHILFCCYTCRRSNNVLNLYILTKHFMLLLLFY